MDITQDHNLYARIIF